MKLFVIPILLALLVGCSTYGPWKAPHPEEVAWQCSPSQDLEMVAEANGMQHETTHVLQTVCGTHEEKDTSKRVDTYGIQATAQEVQYETGTKEDVITIDERSKKENGSYSYTYVRKNKKVTKEGEKKLRSSFGFTFEVNR